jgi:hypothetical protein
MKKELICIPSERYFEIQDLILEKFQGILYAGNREGKRFYEANREALRYSRSLNVDYFDEPITNPTVDSSNWRKENAIVGELTLRNMRKAKGDITYTAYRDLLFSICGLRIYKWWGNQISTWEKMQKEFGDRFNVCWISIDKNKGDYDKLVQWAYDNGKEVWIYVEDYLTKEQIIKELRNI